MGAFGPNGMPVLVCLPGIINTVANFCLFPPKQAAAPADSAAAALEVVSLFSLHCLSTLSVFWVHLGLTACPSLCTCLLLIAVQTFACFPPKQAAAPADNGASNLGPFNVDGISFKVEMNLPGNYVLLNKMMTYSGPGVSTFAACGQLSPDGSKEQLRRWAS